MIVTRQMIRAMSLTAMSVSLISCASSSHEIAAAYVSPTQYAAFNCDQLSLELARLNSRKAELAASIDKKASSDESMTAVSAILFWPAAFALGGNEAQESEYARLKGEYDAVQKAGVGKNCKLDPNKKAKSPLIANYPADRPGESSIFEFYGEAEEEVDSDNINKNTWAKALVEVEGDEAKRKAKYIELRANELYMENVGTVSTVNLNTQSVVGNEDQNLDISGVYASEITESGGRVNFTGKQRRMKITLEQDGNTITGTDSSREIKINGTRKGSTIEFFIIRGNQINGVWEINADATKLEGKWSTDGGGGASGKWNLTRVGTAANISGNQSTTYFDISGTYVSDRIDSNWALKNKAILRIKLNQNLNSVEGEFFKSLDGPIRGSIVDEKLEITWEAGNCNSGEGTLSLDLDGSTLKGFLLCRSQGMRKYDVIFRKI